MNPVRDKQKISTILVRSIVAALVLSVAAVSSRADVTVMASLDTPVARVGEQVRYTITVTGTTRSPSVQLPQFGDAFKLYGGPNVSQQFQIGTGGTSRRISYTYLLMPQKKGKFTIDAATVTLSGKVYRTQPIEIQVMAAGQTVEGAPDTLFARLEVDKQEVYVDEPITVTFSFFWGPTVSLQGDLQYNPPSTEGFFVQDLPDSGPASARIGPTTYNVRRKRSIFIPLRSGDLTIGAATVTGAHRVQNRSSANRRVDPFFDFWTVGNAKAFSRQTKPITIHVKPLPEEDRPPSFTGGVGHYDFEVLTPPKKATVGDSVTLTVRVAGQGYIQGVGAPKLPEAPEYKLYEPESSVNANSWSKTGAEKLFTYVLVPQRAGMLTIPELAFSYFDPEQQKYVTHRKGPFTIEVAPAPEVSPVTVVSVEGGEGNQAIKVIGEDIFTVMSHVKRFKPSGPPPRAAASLVVVVPPMAYLCLLLVVRQRERMRTDKGYVRHRNALRNARRRLLEAEQAMRRGDDVTFYQQIHKGVAEYLADKLDEPAAGITVDDAATLLANAGVDDSLATRITDLLSVCDFGRFGSSGHNAQEQSELLKAAAIAIKELEKILKNREPEGDKQ